MKTSKISASLVTVATMVLFVRLASAQTTPVLVETESTQNSPYPVVTTGDLILGLQATVTGSSLSAIDTATDMDTTQAQFDAELTNGSTVTTGQQGSVAADRSGFAGISDNTTLTYTLPTTSDVTEIESYTSWGDSGRAAQNYTLAYSTNFGQSYTALYTVSSTAGAYSNSGPDTVMVSLTGLLSNATNIRFSFGSNVENGGVGYTEFVVYGTAIPEPRTWGYLAAGLVGLGCFLRRKTARA